MTKSELMDAVAPVPQAGPRHASLRFVARAALACAIVMVALLAVTAVCFGILAAGGSELIDFSWVFAVYVLPSVVLLTVLLFVAAVTLAIVALVRGRRFPGHVGRGSAVSALIIAVVVVLAYVGCALVLAALLHPNTAG